jgi:hypothetical protein
MSRLAEKIATSPFYKARRDHRETLEGELKHLPEDSPGYQITVRALERTFPVEYFDAYPHNRPRPRTPRDSFEPRYGRRLRG